MPTLNELKDKLKTAQNTLQATADKIEAKIQAKYTVIFAKDKDLQQAIKDLENYNEKEVDYQLDHDGLYLWTRVDLTDYSDCLEYLKTYLEDCNCYVDTINDCLMTYLGDDFIGVQSDTRSDNGVWQSHDIIINEAEYTDDNGDIDETLRNELIEAWMEREGCYPNVGVVTRNGDFYPINTTPKKGGKK